MAKLNRDAPFDTVFGDVSLVNYRYVQDGKYFNSDGAEVKPKLAEGQDATDAHSTPYIIVDDIKAEPLTGEATEAAEATTTPASKQVKVIVKQPANPESETL